MECTISVNKFVFLGIGTLVGAVLVFGLARFAYRPKLQSVQSSSAMEVYISKQKQTLSSIDDAVFNAKAAQQLEQFMGDAITITDAAKTVHSHPELQQFATDSTYSWGYNREGVRIIEEDMGLLPKHEGKHCDSVGSC